MGVDLLSGFYAFLNLMFSDPFFWAGYWSLAGFSGFVLVWNGEWS